MLAQLQLTLLLLLLSSSAVSCRHVHALFSQDAQLGAAPHPLRLAATPSELGNMDVEHLRLTAEVREYQTIFGRFTLAWSKWKHLNNHFELALVLKVVVLHLVVEALRHHTAKPCSPKFWIQLCFLTGKQAHLKSWFVAAASGRYPEGVGQW